MINRIWNKGLLIIIVTLSIFSIYSQEKFEPIPANVASQYRFDLARNFFASPEIEKKERRKFYAPLEELEKLKGKTTSSADNLYQALRLYDQVEAEFRIHSLYLVLRYAVDTKQVSSIEDEDNLRAELRNRRGFLKQEIFQLDEQKLARFFAQKIELKIYDFAIENICRSQPHTLSTKEEELLSATSPLAANWQGDFYRQARQNINFGTIRTANGDVDVARQSGEIENNPDRRVREEGFKKNLGGFATRRDLFAFALIRLVRANNKLAQLRNYKDAPDENYFASYLTTERIKDLYEQLAQQAEINKRYERAVANRIRKNNGYEDVNNWDINAPRPNLKPVRYSISETSKIIQTALEPLGAEYRRELASLLDPANGRIDIAPAANRLPTSFASTYPVPHSIFYSFNYEGYYLDLIKLGHEAGHAVQGDLMRNNCVPYLYARGPAYFSESFAIFNEMLIADHLYQTENDAARKEYYLEQFLDRTLKIYDAVTFADLEQKIYEGVEQNRINNADDLDKMMRETGSRYSIWHAKHREFDGYWSLIDGYYNTPLFSHNNVVAKILALKYFELYKRDPKKFIPRYNALLRNGYTTSPENLLKKFLDIDLNDPQFASGFSQIVEEKLKSFEVLN